MYFNDYTSISSSHVHCMNMYMFMYVQAILFTYFSW